MAIVRDKRDIKARYNQEYIRFITEYYITYIACLIYLVALLAVPIWYILKVKGGL